MGRDRILTSNLPTEAGGNGHPAAWYSRTRPCEWCRGRVVRRVERPAGAQVRVQHEGRCRALSPNEYTQQ
jgi:hypothetical protein